MQAKRMVLATIIIAIMSLSILPFAYAADWATVTTITGSADQTSKTFNITVQEWRLKWSYTPDSRFPSLSFFGVLVYPEGEGASYIDSFYVNGSTQTQGVENINGTAGNYHLEILDANIPSYTIVVQQYGGIISSLSEDSGFGSLTNLILLVLVAGIVAIVAVVVLFKRRRNNQLKEESLLSSSRL
jgi:hypothetical protein